MKVHPINEFRRKSKRGDFGESKLSSLGGFLPVYHAPRGKEFFLPWFTFHLWARKRGFFCQGPVWRRKKRDFRVLLLVRLGEGLNLPTEDWFFA